jgi:hypothetical protein
MISDELEKWKSVEYRMKEEGFDYCFNGYSSWKEIKDKKFHSLVDQYLDISKRIKELVDSKIKNLS